MQISVPVLFGCYFDRNKLFFATHFFINFQPFVLDSTNTYPGMYHIESEESYYVNSRNFMPPYQWPHDKPYSTVRLGFEIDTAGIVSDQKIVTSVDPTLDAMALDFIIQSSGKWIPARKNGVKVPSYKYFDCLFTDIYVNNLSSYHAARTKYAKDLHRGYRTNLTIAADDKLSATEFLAQKKYEEALEKFDRAARYYTKDANLFFNRTVAHYNAGNKSKSCDDLQHVLDIAETEGFPAGISKQSVEELIIKHCQ